MISVAIPALNEEIELGNTVRNVIRAAEAAHVKDIDIICIDDGSTDRTSEVIKNLEAEYPFVQSVRHKTNLGMGASFLSAIQVAKGDRITIFPGDNNTTPYLMKELFEHAYDADMVISYFLNTEGRSAFRHFVSTIYCTIYALTFGLHLKYTHGSVIYSVDKLRAMNLKSAGYSLLVELNIKLLRQGATFVEVAGYLNPKSRKSTAIRLKVLFDVIFSYLRIVYEVYVKDRAKYGHSPVRVLPKTDLILTELPTALERSL